jgi:hypothetical protein
MQGFLAVERGLPYQPIPWDEQWGLACMIKGWFWQLCCVDYSEGMGRSPENRLEATKWPRREIMVTLTWVEYGDGKIKNVNSVYINLWRHRELNFIELSFPLLKRKDSKIMMCKVKNVILKREIFFGRGYYLIRIIFNKLYGLLWICIEQDIFSFTWIAQFCWRQRKLYFVM